MSEERFDRIEGMLTQLIGVVAETNKKYDSMDARMEGLEGRITSMKESQDTMRVEMNGFRDDQKSMRKEMNGFRDDQKSMHKEMNGFRDGQKSMHKEVGLIREENAKRHQQVMEGFSSLEADQDHIWNKTVTNERNFAKFKIQYGI